MTAARRLRRPPQDVPLRLAAAVRTPLGRRALRRGVFPAAVHEAMLRRLEPDFVVDVGANRGQFALDVHAAAPDARILAFEPLVEQAAVFREIFASEQQVVLEQIALGSERGTRLLHLSASPDNSSLLPIGSGQVELFPGTEETGCRMVPVGCLADYRDELGACSRRLLKLDVQGAELGVLAGAVDVLTLFEWVYVEVSFAELYDGQPLAHEIIAWLVEREFLPAHIGAIKGTRGQAVQADMLFSRRTARDPAKHGVVA